MAAAGRSARKNHADWIRAEPAGHCTVLLPSSAEAPQIPDGVMQNLMVLPSMVGVLLMLRIAEASPPHSKGPGSEQALA